MACLQPLGTVATGCTRSRTRLTSSKGGVNWISVKDGGADPKGIKDDGAGWINVMYSSVDLNSIEDTGCR
jgi:hypothetical protein